MSRLTRALYYLQHDPSTFFYFLRKRGHRALNLFFAQRSGRSSYLQKLWLPITYKCNLRCSMCGQWGDLGRSLKYAPEKLREELSLPTLKEIVDSVASSRPKICLIGGEPLLSPHWYELAHYIRSRGLFVEITTNGLKLGEEADRAWRVFDAIHVSLDGPPAINDQIRSVPGGFQKAMGALAKIAELKRTAKKKKPFLSICCTLFSTNLPHLKELPEAIEASKVPIDLLLFQHLEITDSEIIQKTNERWQEEFGLTTPWWEANCHTLDASEVEPAWETLELLKKTPYPHIGQILVEPDLTCEEMLQFYGKGKTPPARFQGLCHAPFQEAFVYPDGTVWTCPGLPMGNVREESFSNIYNGPEYQKLRKSLVERGSFPICSRCANHWHNWST